MQLFAEDSPEEEDAQRRGEQLGEGERPPDRAQAAQAAQQPRDRQDDQQLADDGDQQAVKSVAQRLEDGGGHDAEAGEQEAETDDPERLTADGEALGLQVIIQREDVFDFMYNV